MTWWGVQQEPSGRNDRERAAADRLRERIEAISLPAGVQATVVTVPLASTGGLEGKIVVWGPATRLCTGCRQGGRPTQRPCPIALSASQGEVVPWSQQHGCGAWWGPQWTTVEIDIDDWPGMAEAVREEANALELVGAKEIAERAGVARDTVAKWQLRDIGFPRPHAKLSMGTVWLWSDVQEWLDAR